MINKKKKLTEIDASDISPFKGNIIIGKTNHPEVIEEYWAYIKYLSIPKKFEDTFCVKICNEEEMFSAFRTFIQQGYEYYSLAKKASFQVAPLCYYYSFLNLTKAYLVPKHWKSKEAKFARHGLAQTRTGKKLVEGSLTIGDGVFELAAEDLTNHLGLGYWKSHKISINETFFYMHDISVELREFYDTSPWYVPAKVEVVVKDKLCDLIIKTEPNWFEKTYPHPNWSPRRINKELNYNFKTSNKKGDEKWIYNLRKRIEIIDDSIENNESAIRNMRDLVSKLAPNWSVLPYSHGRVFLIPYSRKSVLPVELNIMSVMYYLTY